MEFEFNKPEPVEAAEPVVEDVVVEETKPVVEEVAAEEPKKKTKEGLVTLYSAKNASQPGLVPLKAGNNKMTKEDADKWIALKSYVKIVEDLAK